MLNRLIAFNDPKLLTMLQLTVVKAAANALLKFMIKKGLSPAQTSDGEPKALENPTS
jgi:hypothetical protein